jgi:Tfp pilus assembly protein PilO
VITSRDRKIMLILMPLVVLAVYWFVVLAPQRTESQKVAVELTTAQSARDQAEQQVTSLNASKASFVGDYATVIRLGKAIPTTVDMPSLLVQIDRAAQGTRIKINDFKPGPAVASSGSSGAAASAAGTPPGGGANPAAPGSAPAQGFPAKQAQHAGNAVTQANGTNQANADKANAGPTGATGTTSPQAPGLTSVPLTFTMTGSFFDLADFFHRMKRFVQVVNDQIVVRGRLMTIESFDFSKTGPGTSVLRADVNATIYLTPPDQGTTAGATPAGPSGGAAGAAQPATPGSATPPTPTATATP